MRTRVWVWASSQLSSKASVSICKVGVSGPMERVGGGGWIQRDGVWNSESVLVSSGFCNRRSDVVASSNRNGASLFWGPEF